VLRLRGLRRGALVGIGCLLVGSIAVAGTAVPLPSELPAAARGRVEAVTEGASLATHLDSDPFPARREIFEYLLDHPEFATRITQALRLARYKIWRTPEGLVLDDGWGTVGTIEVVYAAPGTRLMYARGAYQQRVLPDIHGQAVVQLDYAPTVLPDGRDAIATSLTGYVKLDSALLAWASRLASAIARAKAAKEAASLVKVFARTSRAIADDPDAVVAALRQRSDVSPADLADFCRLLSATPALAASH